MYELAGVSQVGYVKFTEKTDSVPMSFTIELA